MSDIPNGSIKHDEVFIPDYLSTLLSEIAVKENFSNYTVAPESGSNIGDGFQGLMIRIVIDGTRHGENNQLRLICKIPPQSEIRKKMVMESFVKEIYTYDVLLPAFVQFQHDRGVKTATEGFFAFPKCYGTYSNPDTFDFALVLDDLKAVNFDMWNKFEKLDFAHAKLAVCAIGRFHALSFAIRDQSPELFSKISNIGSAQCKMVKTEKMFADFYVKAFETAGRTLDASELKLIENLESMKKNFVEKLEYVTSLTSAEPFSVLNHGDFWNNNMMFEYEHGNVKNVKSVCLIDWQLGQFCSPATDLAYYLYSSTEQQLRDEHFDDLLNAYYKSLADTLKRLGSDAEQLFTFNDFQGQLKKFSMYGLITAPILVQIITVKPDDIPDLDAMTESDDFDLMSKGMSKAYKIRMHDVIKDFVERGYFN